ncbi:hypothetical protein ABT282_07190 [Streptomyces sp. NPDC000927]|uniref:hypothetical protein n=1 Tax=Streptomyces sp. NPDC000927 TaxID=3154371 RepID=UPI003318F75A
METSSRDQVVAALEREMVRWLNWTGREERQAMVDFFEEQYRASGQVAPWLK